MAVSEKTKTTEKIDKEWRRKECVAGVMWWLRVDSNHRPSHYECDALTN